MLNQYQDKLENVRNQIFTLKQFLSSVLFRRREGSNECQGLIHQPHIRATHALKNIHLPRKSLCISQNLFLVYLIDLHSHVSILSVHPRDSFMPEVNVN